MRYPPAGTVVSDLGKLLVPSLLGLAFLVAGCGDTEPEELLITSPTTEIRFAQDRSMTIAAGLLDDLDLSEGMVLVPSDRAVFALDADGLADLVNRGFDGLIDASVVPVDHGTSLEDWPAVLTDRDGGELPVLQVDGVWTVDGHPVVDVWRRDGVTVVVLDGVLDR